MAITSTAPICPMASLAKPMRSGKMVPPKRPMIMSPLTSFCFSGMAVRACAKHMEKTLLLP